MSDTSKRTELTTHSPEISKRAELSTTSNQPIAPLPPVPPGGSVLEHALARLPQDQQDALMQKALEKKIELEVKAADAKQGHINFERESEQSVEHVQKLGRTGMDITANYEGRTASGRWDFQARKSNYTVVMVIAAIIGIVLLIVALR